MNESNEDTKDSVQVCSIVHVAHVHVRRVMHVIVQNGFTDVEGVLVIVHTFNVAIYVAICSCFFTLTVGDSRLLSAVTDIYIYIFTINLAFNCC